MNKKQTTWYLIITAIAFIPLLCYGLVGRAMEDAIGLHGMSFFWLSAGYLTFWMVVLMINQHMLKSRS